MVITRFAVPAVLAGMAALGCAGAARAEGMQPATSVVILPTDAKVTTIKVTNTGETAELLLVEILPIDEDTEDVALVQPGMAEALVKPGREQQVTFTLLDSARASKVQRLRRVVFEGAKGRPKRDNTPHEVNVTVRQNLPLIVHPAGLELIRDPWKFLAWTRSGGNITVSNDSPYVVRLAQEIRVLPSNTPLGLEESYVLPGRRLTLKLPAAAASDHQVRIFPATVYGFATDHFDAPLTESH